LGSRKDKIVYNQLPMLTNIVFDYLLTQLPHTYPITPYSHTNEY